MHVKWSVDWSIDCRVLTGKDLDILIVNNKKKYLKQLFKTSRVSLASNRIYIAQKIRKCITYFDLFLFFVNAVYVHLVKQKYIATKDIKI